MNFFSKPLSPQKLIAQPLMVQSLVLTVTSSKNKTGLSKYIRSSDNLRELFNRLTEKFPLNSGGNPDSRISSNAAKNTSPITKLKGATARSENKTKNSTNNRTN